MDDKTIQSIVEILKRGYRVEIIPVKDGLRIFQIRREEIKNDS